MQLRRLLFRKYYMDYISICSFFYSLYDLRFFPVFLSKSTEHAPFHKFQSQPKSKYEVCQRFSYFYQLLRYYFDMSWSYLSSDSFTSINGGQLHVCTIMFLICGNTTINIDCSKESSVTLLLRLYVYQQFKILRLMYFYMYCHVLL